MSPKAKRNREKRRRARLPRAAELPPETRSFAARLARADDHLDEAQEQIEGWIKDSLKTISHEPDPEEPSYRCTWITPPDLDAHLLSLRIGDGLQCLRSALDHLAFELASSFTSPLPDEIAKQSEFPIFGDEDGDGSGRFHRLRSKGPLAGAPAPGSGLAKTVGMNPKAQAAIERLQPYRRGQSYTDDPLWKLHELNRVDKHRLLHVVATVMGGQTIPTAALTGTRKPGEKVEFTVKTTITPKSRTQIARWPVSIAPHEEAQMNFSPILDVVFGPDTPVVGDLPVRDVLREVREHVERAVLPKLTRFVK